MSKKKEKTKEKKHVKIFIATPAYGHQVTTTYMNSMMKLIGHKDPDISFTTMIHLQSGMALITQARNNCVATFMETDCDKMLFIDSDIGFDPEAVVRLAKKDVDVALTPYPVKGYGKNGGLQFIVHFKDKDKVEVEDDGFLEIKAGPTGFMMIDRKVFEKMAKHYPEKKCVNTQLVGNSVIKMKSFWYTFFDTDVHPEHGYLGEDIAFCNLWTKMGGKIYADAETALTHYGGHGYKGNLQMMFHPLEVDEEEEKK